MICCASRWIEAIPIKVSDAQAVLSTFHDNWITRYGVPNEVLSDNSSIFDGKEASKFWLDRQIEKVKVSPHHQASNGLSERKTASLIDALKIHAEDEPTDWAKHLQTAIASLRNKVCSATELSPYQYVFGANMPSPLTQKLQISNRIEIAARLMNQLRTVEDQHALKSTFKINDLVLVGKLATPTQVQSALERALHGSSASIRAPL